MRLLDLFCGAGGAAKGYQEAGFYVVGVDIVDQPNYCGDEFHQGDALEAAMWMDGFDLIHASPPCQSFVALSVGRWGKDSARWPDLIAPTRKLLEWSGKPYVIENVSGARSNLINPVELTGEMFGLLAWRIAATHLRNTESWLDWEDYPELDEPSFERLDSSVQNVAAWLLEQSLRRDFDADIDSAHLLEQIQ